MGTPGCEICERPYTLHPRSYALRPTPYALRVPGQAARVSARLCYQGSLSPYAMPMLLLRRVPYSHSELCLPACLLFAHLPIPDSAVLTSDVTEVGFFCTLVGFCCTLVGFCCTDCGFCCTRSWRTRPQSSPSFAKPTTPRSY
eukprot:2606870-Rhodomonas_salina.4